MKIKDMIGVTITNVREMTKEEAEEQGWDHLSTPAIEIELSSGVKIYAQQDEENNGPGCLVFVKGDAMTYGFDLARTLEEIKCQSKEKRSDSGAPTATT